MEMAASPNYPHEALPAAKGIVSSLLLAVKMFSLYADDHAHCRSSVARLHEYIENFLQEYGDLVFQVEKNRLVFAKKGVHRGSEKDGDIVFALFRDGVLDLLFQKGLELEETTTFLRILDQYRTLSVEAEGDIVTALWEADLPHIRYRAADNILETMSEAEDQSSEQQGDQARKGWNAAVPLEMHMIAENMLDAAQGARALPQIDLAQVQLSADEAKKLEGMVREEEERDATEEILDMMADILRSEQDEAFFVVILEYLEDELHAAFDAEDFNVLFAILTRLHQIRQLCEDFRPWALPLVDGFLERASKTEFLETLNDSWENLNESQLKMAGKTLFLLSPQSIKALAPMLPKAPSSAVQTVLSKAIVGLAARNFGPFEDLLESGDDVLLYHMVPLLGHMTHNKSALALVRAAKHPSEQVRRVALETVIARGLWAPEKLMPLIDDESDTIRRLLLKYLGSRKDEVAETQLMIYLRERKSRNSNHAHVMACFRALGRCGTGHSLGFLRDAFLGGWWISKFFKSLKRQGAAIALTELGTEESRGILQEALNSRYPGIRRAARACVSDQSISGESP